MAIDANRVTSLIDELGLQGADKEYFTKVLTSNESAATQFVGQRERFADYTRSKQALATEKAELERRANEQITGYANQLAEAEGKIQKILKDFETADISRATAEARLQRVKQTYNLTDDDIPAVEIKPAAAPAAQPAIDIDAKLAEFERKLMARLTPDLNAFPQVAAVMDDIADQHQQLTGKRLTLAERQEIIRTSQAENGPTLVKAWREKHGIDKIEQDRQKASWREENRREWEDEQKRRNSEEALRQVRSTPDGQTRHLSPVFREYKTDNDPVRQPGAEPARQSEHVAPVQNEPGPRLSGAERAAQRFLERRNAGIPMGAPDPVGAK